MHKSAMMHGKLFFDTYAPHVSGARVLDLGALDVNGSLRSLAPADCSYVGADFAPGNGVDVILQDAYALPFEPNSFDICVSSSCFEHAEFFWLAFTEVMRILKPHGLFYMNSPSNGKFHRYPVDCWRFYPDSAAAMARWARRMGYAPKVLECFWGKQGKEGWNDYVAVFVKDGAKADQYPDRIVRGFSDFTNGFVDEGENILNRDRLPEDKRHIQRLGQAPA
ncbi:MAG: class I SAM-dependent methyltransferase [Pseudomonadota bacterium]